MKGGKGNKDAKDEKGVDKMVYECYHLEELHRRTFSLVTPL